MSIAARVRMEDVRVLSDDWYVLRKATFSYLRSDGTWQRQSRESYDRGDGAVILLYDGARRTVIMVRQFRYSAFVNGADELLIEAPAGLLDNAHPADRIRAEAEEETGYRIQNPVHLFDAYMSPGAVTEKLHFFAAEYTAQDRVSDGGGHEGEGEDIEVMEMSFDEAMSLMALGGIQDAKTMLLLQYAALNIFNPKT
jgi:nudix-type nucleoside diphosphatase (YffH/AdpP family)